jgi:hypothetical protein
MREFWTAFYVHAAVPGLAFTAMFLFFGLIGALAHHTASFWTVIVFGMIALTALWGLAGALFAPKVFVDDADTSEGGE